MRDARCSCPSPRATSSAAPSNERIARPSTGADATEAALLDARRIVHGNLVQAALLVGIAAFLPSPARAAADSTRVFLEVGTGADVSNQVFYEQTFDSTAFSGRVTVSDPETRVGGLALVRLAAARGRTSILLSNETRAGDALLRNLARAGVVHETGAHGRVSLDLEADARRDRSFGTRRDDLRLGALASARASSTDRAWGGRAFVRGERVRGEEGDGTLRLFPDFDWLQAGLDLDRLWPGGGTLSLGYALGARSFPDTAARNHVEHALTGNGLWRARERVTFDAFASAARRVARRDSALGDRSWQGDAEARGTIRAGDRWELGARSRLRWMRYDEPTATFFDARFWRHAVFARLRADSGLEVELRPEIEFARTPEFGGLPADAPVEDRRAVASEEYDEVALRLDVERFGKAGWWMVSTAFGRRDHSDAATTAEDLSARSDFWFAEGSGFADRRLAGRVTLRASADLRLERHDVDADDATSLSLAAELRVPLL